MDPQHFANIFNPELYQFRPFAVLYVLAAVVIALTASFVVYWEKGSRPSALIGGFSGLFAIWCLERAMRLCLDDQDVLIILARMSYGLVELSLPLLYWFVCIVLQQETARMRSIRLNLMFSGLLAPLSTGTPWLLTGEFYRARWGYEAVFGPLGWVVTLWIAGLIAVSAVDILRAYRRAAKGSRQQRRIVLLGLACLALYGEGTELVSNWRIEAVPLGFLCLPVFALLAATLARRYGLVEYTPQLAAKQLAELVRGAVLIMDLDGVIQYTNAHAEQLLGSLQRLASTNARSLGQAFAPESVRLLAHRPGPEAEKDLLYRRERDGETRDLALSALPVHDSHGADVAYACVIRDTTEHRRAEYERLRQSLHDPLTGLSNRSLFLARLDDVTASSAQPSRPVAVLFLGLKRLRVINEDLGYAMGDRVLQEVAMRLRQALNAPDSVARLGGDEFGVLVKEVGSEAQLLALVQRLHACIREPLAIAEPQVHISASIGVATSGDGEYASGADLLRAAGAAMHAAKEQAGGAATKTELGSGQRTRLESELRLALERGEFEPWFQPVVDLDTASIVGFEALLRWRQPERGLLLPGKFIEFAEEIGLLPEIDRRVLALSCQGLAALQAASGKPQLTVSINLCAEELGHDGIVEQIRLALQSHGLAPRCLNVEVLENVTLNAAVQANLHALRRLGVGIYVDDFGIGYSALSRLHELPVTLLKIDREFVRAMSLGRGGEQTISSIIALARSLNLSVIAEGVESAEEARRLRAHGCQQVQGFLFSPAIPLAAAKQLLADSSALAAAMGPRQQPAGTEA